MKTALLQKEHVILQKGVEESVEHLPRKKSAELAQKDFGVFIFIVFLISLILKFLGAWVGRESLKIQKAPGKFVSPGEEYQELHNQLGPNSFLRLH